jgi:hypothetical protein
MPFTGWWRVMNAVCVAVMLGVSVAHAQGSNGPDAVVPFRIQIPDSVLTDLKQRLGRARFADEFTAADWNYGTNLAYLQALVAYWRDRYDYQGSAPDQRHDLLGHQQRRVIRPHLPGRPSHGRRPEPDALHTP